MLVTDECQEQDVIARRPGVTLVGREPMEMHFQRCSCKYVSPKGSGGRMIPARAPLPVAADS